METNCDRLAEHPETPPTSTQESDDLLPPEEGEDGESSGNLAALHSWGPLRGAGRRSPAVWVDFRWNGRSQIGAARR